jgi:hypothetical protein
MKYIKGNTISLIISIFIISGCSTTKLADQGKVTPDQFYAKRNFETAKSLIVIPCELDGQAKNFLFDTGAQVSAVQRDSIFGDIIQVRGASNRTVENGSETIKSFKIGDVDFVNTFATNENMIGLKEKIPNFGGVLGRSIINKANWLINYPNKTIEISNRELANESFTAISLDKSVDAPYTTIEIDRRQYKAIIDLGSTSTFNVPAETELAKQLLLKYNFQQNKRERYTLGGVEVITEQVGRVPKMKIGDLEFTDVEVNINQSSQTRVGMPLFENCMIYIDNTNRKYSIMKM